MTGLATVLRADARSLPLPDASVDLIVTSPPYFALRSYTDAGEHYGGQIGAEATPQEYIAALVECTREWMRALKPGGSLWVNLGDKYASSGGHGASATSARADRKSHQEWSGRTERNNTGVPTKSLILLPERYRIACIDDLRLIARSVVVWSKPNGLPESVTDRVRRSHEDWVHLVKQPKYYSAVDEIREEHTSGAHGAARAARRDTRADSAARWPGRHEVTDYRIEREHKAMSPLGKLPGSVWEIATEPLTVPDNLGVDHFAAFPTEWPRRIILGWSPSGICIECGQGRRPVASSVRSVNQGKALGRLEAAAGAITGGTARSTLGNARGIPSAVITGYACACPEPTAPTRPAVVLDPFGGTGTTALVAKALGRHGISVDRSADYCRLAQWRTTDPGQLAKAMRVEKPPRQLDGQVSLFDELEASA